MKRRNLSLTSRLIENFASFPCSQSIQSEVDEFADVKLEDLKEIATLGVGGFGRVELVKYFKILYHNELKNKVNSNLI